MYISCKRALSEKRWPFWATRTGNEVNCRYSLPRSMPESVTLRRRHAAARGLPQVEIRLDRAEPASSRPASAAEGRARASSSGIRAHGAARPTPSPAHRLIRAASPAVSARAVCDELFPATYSRGGPGSATRRCSRIAQRKRGFSWPRSPTPEVAALEERDAGLAFPILSDLHLDRKARVSGAHSPPSARAGECAKPSSAK